MDIHIIIRKSQNYNDNGHNHSPTLCASNITDNQSNKRILGRDNVKNNYRNLNEYKLALKFEQDNVSNKIQVAIEIAEKAPELISNAIGKEFKATGYNSSYGNYTTYIKEVTDKPTIGQYIEIMPGVRVVAECSDKLDLKKIYKVLKSGVISESRIQVQA